MTDEFLPASNWLPSVLDGVDCKVPCKPKEHAEHDVLCSTDHDAHYCYTCDHWVEAICSGKKCTFCKGRPEKMVKDSTE